MKGLMEGITGGVNGGINGGGYWRGLMEPYISTVLIL